MGFNRRCRLQLPPHSTMTKNKAVISQYMHQEVSLGRMQDKHTLVQLELFPNEISKESVG